MKKCKCDRITPNNITNLNDNEIFVFGSNESGYHGGGAAKTALKWGAVWGHAVGLQGNTYAIPTKTKNAESTLPLDEISNYINIFIDFAKENKSKQFLVTEIGCGLAGLKVKDVAPLFIGAVAMENVALPINFWERLTVDIIETDLDIFESMIDDFETGGASYIELEKDICKCKDAIESLSYGDK